MSRRHYPLRVARTAHGIRAQNLRALSRSVWWTRRWIDMLEGLRLGPRLGRGRQYALSGQVTDLAIADGRVEAHVLGSRPDPYLVKLDFTADPEPGKAGAVARALAEPMTLGRLLADDLPLEVEEAFALEGRSLFAPGRTWCSCPDWRKPCKHVAAVLFLLGEAVAHRPALLLEMKGVDWEALLPPAPPAADGAEPDLVSLDGMLAAFGADDPAPLISRLGPVPFWRGTEKFMGRMGEIYSRVRPEAERLAGLRDADDE